jgi:flagellar assembly protein FliH
MLKAVFRPNELVTLAEKIIIDTPGSYSEVAHLSAIEDDAEDLDDVEEYTGPTAEDLRREAEMFKTQWEEEKEQMISSAKAEAENIVQAAQSAAFAEVKRQTDEAQILKQQAEDEAQKILEDARLKASEMEAEVRRSLDAERNEARETGKKEGKEEGYAEGKAEVDRLIERTQVVLERAQNKRGEILSDSEREIVSLVLLISRKVIKVLSENQRDIIISNVIEALRKVKAKGNVIIRVNLADLQLATEHKQDFIRLMESAKSVQIVEDSSVDSGGCIIETDFGEIDARIASQLAELENKILEISPIQPGGNNSIPQPVVRTANLNADLAASSTIMDALSKSSNEGDASDLPVDSDDPELSTGASAALTASAALAALATMATKGKREVDKKITSGLDTFTRRKSDNPAS